MSKDVNIYLGLTTTENSDWRSKIAEIKKMGLQEIALFPTAIEPNERQELYELLEQTSITYIPFVHLRHDSTQEEIAYYRERYKTKYFNIHAYPEAMERYKSFMNHEKEIFIENTDHLTKEFFDEVPNFAGICIDFAHYEDYGILQKEPSYDNFLEFLKNNPAGLAHVGGVKKTAYFKHYEFFSKHDLHYSTHRLDDLSELDYLKRYKSYFPKIVAIELENTLEEQQKIKDYIEKEILGKA